MFTKFKQFLNQPYPDHGGFKGIVVGSLITLLVVFGFLAFFQPFDLHTAGDDATKIAFYFGLISFATIMLFECFINYVLKIKRNGPSWTFWKWFVMVITLILVISIANYIFVLNMLGRDSYVADFAVMLRSTLAVGIFPTFAIGALNMYQKTKVNQKIADAIQDVSIDVPTSVNVSLPVKNSTKTLEIDASNILFVEAMQNYVQIHHLHDNAAVKKEMHRNTITALEQVLKDSSVQRCHRSYLVNRSMVKGITGNAQGLKLEMKHGDGVVPVSRKYIPLFRPKS